MVWVYILAIIALMALPCIILYFLSIRWLFPEKIRTNDIYYIRTRDLWLLRLCRYRNDSSEGEPVLLVHGMGSNQNNFTFPEGGCLVDYLSARGYDCWTVDLRGCRSSEPPFERTRNEVIMEDFLLEDLPATIQFILKTTGYKTLHWIGHSMGGMLLYAYAPVHGTKHLASGTTLGSPIDFNDAAQHVPKGLITLAAAFPRTTGTVARGFVPIIKALRIPQTAFPVNRNNLPDSMQSSHFVNMIEDPLPALMRQLLHWIHRRTYTLLNGQLDVRQTLPNFETPLLAFYASNDPFVNPDTALLCFNSIKNSDKKAFVCGRKNGFIEDYSHCDLAFGKAAEKEIFEPILQWLQAHPCRLNTVEITPPLSAEQYVSPGEKTTDGQEVAGIAISEEEHIPLSQRKRKTVRSVAKAKPLPQKNATITKKPPVKKKTTARKPTSTRNVAVKKTTSQSVISVDTALSKDSGSGIELDPETLARAEAIRMARNQLFAELGAKLDDSPKRDTP